MKKNNARPTSFSLFEPPVEPKQAEEKTEERARSSPAKVKDPCPRCGSRGMKSVRPHEHDGLTHYCSVGCLSDDRTDCFYYTPRAETFDEAAERERAKTEFVRVSDEEPVAIATLQCPRCGVERIPKAKVCPYCGLSGSTSVIAPSSENLVVETIEDAKVAPPSRQEGGDVPYEASSTSETAPDVENTAETDDPTQHALFENDEKWREHWKGMPAFVQENLEPWKSIYVHFESRKDMDAFSRLIDQKITLDTRAVWYPESEVLRNTNKRYVEKEAADDRKV